MEGYGGVMEAPRGVISSSCRRHGRGYAGVMEGGGWVMEGSLIVGGVKEVVLQGVLEGHEGSGRGH